MLPNGMARAAETWQRAGGRTRCAASKCCAGSNSFSPSSTASWPTPRSSANRPASRCAIDAENWDDIRPKAAVAANVGAGPDIIIGTNDDPFKFPDKLLDVTELAEYLGAKNGGWYPLPEATACSARNGSRCRKAAAAGPELSHQLYARRRIRGVSRATSRAF